LADIFPPMSEEEFSRLKADIRQHGVRDPVWLFDNQIIDGRHRVRACQELGITCPTREFAGSAEKILPLVLSMNLARRHLGESQRAMVAAHVADQWVGSRANLHSGGAATLHRGSGGSS